MNIDDYRYPSTSYPQLSLRDLLDAREQHHIHLMRHPNVVATAIGRYLIRSKDSWPTKSGPGKVHGTYPRTLANSQVRDYSWPAILVFVKRWVPFAALAGKPDTVLPKAVYLPDGRVVPICVVEAEKEDSPEVRPVEVRYPLNNIGGGSPVIARVQGREHVATIACLVSDGHKVHALTNRHVAGDPGEVVYARRDGSIERIGISSEKHLTREAFTTLYPGWPGRDVYVNLDIGLIEVDDLHRWTTDIAGIGQMGKMVDLSASTITLALVGCQVRGAGAASGMMAGEIHALFYRYQTTGGFEYVADVLIGPSSRKGTPKGFATHPGDSGTLWLLKPRKEQEGGEVKEYLPLAVQWGRNVLYSAGAGRPQSFVLATFLARVCAQLGVDPIRNWNVDQPNTWGAIGHFSIAALARTALSARFPKLVSLMEKNADIVSRDEAAILEGDFTGMGSEDFVPLADVPDFFWKPRIAKQGHARPMEGPNHFADMDQPGPDGKTLLDLCKKDAFIDPDAWDTFYSSVNDLLSGEPIQARHRGLLPFRVWQIFNSMVESASKGKAAEFVCAAGVLTHYIGDACQPLHISYLHDGDPEQKVEHTFQTGKHVGETETRPLGAGVHAAYEDAMVHAFREEILDGLKETPKATKAELLGNGFEAAKRTIALMRETFNRIPPRDIVDAFVGYDGPGNERSAFLWKKFGKGTVRVMQGGCHLLAVLWESAWALGDGESNVKSPKAVSRAEAMKVCAEDTFLPSLPISKIGGQIKA